MINNNNNINYNNTMINQMNPMSIKNMTMMNPKMMKNISMMNMFYKNLLDQQMNNLNNKKKKKREVVQIQKKQKAIKIVIIVIVIEVEVIVLLQNLIIHIILKKNF